MNEKELAYYIKGLMDISSTLSSTIGLSDIKVLGYKKENFLDKFSKDYKLDKEKIELKKVVSLEEKIKEWFGNNDKITDNLLYYIKQSIESIENTYISNDYLIEALSAYNKGLSGLYFVEDIFMIENKNTMIVFLLGNNE